MSIFEKASRKGLRFNSVYGAISTERLWDLPLTAKGNGDDLDSIAKDLARTLREFEEESFVSSAKPEGKYDTELSLEIVKRVIEYKLEQSEKASKREETNKRKEMLLEALSQKENDEVSTMSKDEILEKLATL